VLVRPNGDGDSMWNAELPSSRLALLTVPFTYFVRTPHSAPASAFITLPAIPSPSPMQNHYTERWLLYGVGDPRGPEHPNERPAAAGVFAYDLQTRALYAVALGHDVARIESLGSDALIVGSDGRSLHFSTVALEDAPSAVDDYIDQASVQGEARTHAFYYLPTGPRRGVLGLPLVTGRRAAAAPHGSDGADSVTFLQVDGLHIAPAGSLTATQTVQRPDDHCLTSCDDWYGNSRPIFQRDRIFALLGYELVEGHLADGALSVIARLDFTPAAASSSGSSPPPAQQ
jgi:hypothetical protein